MELAVEVTGLSFVLRSRSAASNAGFAARLVLPLADDPGSR